MYTFEKITHEEFWEKATASYGGEWVYQPGEASEETYALFYGKMRTLFGAPDDESESWEEMYNYLLKATDGTHELYLNVYHGAGGSSNAIPIKGDDLDAYAQAKADLLDLIRQAEPADYVWQGVYEDIPVNTTYTVKDGKATVTSDFGEDFDMEDMF